MLFLVAVTVVTIPFLMHRHRRLAFSLILLAFVFAGATRLAFVNTNPLVPDEETGDSVYEAVVIESSPRIKILDLTTPAEMKGMRVVFLSDPAVEAGQRVRIFGRMRELIPSFKNPGTTSWKWLKRMEGVAYELKGRVVSTLPADNVIGRMRAYFKCNIENSAAPYTDILKALTIGDRTSIAEERNNLFLRTGTSHVLAVSGFNVGIITGFFFLIVRMSLGRIRTLGISGRHTRYASVLTIPFPFIFMLVAGAGVSVIRATIMIIVFMLAIFFERQKHFYNTTALAALIILVLYPHSLFTPSFQLTFMSLLFIVVFMERLFPLITRVKSRIATWSLSTVLSTAAATLGTAPIAVYYFYGLNPFCLVHNLVTIPLIGVAATALSLIGMTFPDGRYLLFLAGKITSFNIDILQFVDFGYLYPIVRPDLPEVLLYYAVLLALVKVRRKPVAFLLCLVLIPLSAIQLYSDYRQRFNNDLRIHFIDVGAGDSTLIEAPGGMRILIDGGGFHGSDFDVGRHVITPFLLFRKIRHIDYVVNTHPHDDHIGGLPYILRHFAVSHLVTAGPYPSDTKFLELDRIAAAKAIPHSIWKRGDRLQAGNFTMEVLHPERGDVYDSTNNSSLVLRIVHRDRAILLPADIESDVEEKLLVSGTTLRSDVLKVPHHGSASSNGFAFISAVKPRLAVLSAAGGVKGPPSQTALNRYHTLSIPLLRTDKQGLVEIKSNGKELQYRTHERQFQRAQNP